MSTPSDNKLYRIATTGIIWKKGEDGRFLYLITKRAPHKKAWPNKWTVPGGGLEPEDYKMTKPTYQDSESPAWYNAIEKALRREIQEEVGLEVRDPKYLVDIAFVRSDGLPALVLSFYCEYKSGDVHFDKDTVDSAWIRVEELKKFDFIQGIDHEIEMVEKRLTAL